MGLQSPFEIDYLNFDMIVKENSDKHFKFTIYMSLARQVVYQKRVVYDIFMMFGDVGGLYDFLIISLAPLLSFLSSKFMVTELLKSLFLVLPASKSKSTLQSLEKVQFPLSFTLFSWPRKKN